MLLCGSACHSMQKFFTRNHCIEVATQSSTFSVGGHTGWFWNGLSNSAVIFMSKPLLRFFFIIFWEFHTMCFDLTYLPSPTFLPISASLLNLSNLMSFQKMKSDWGCSYILGCMSIYYSWVNLSVMAIPLKKTDSSLPRSYKLPVFPWLDALLCTHLFHAGIFVWL